MRFDHTAHLRLALECLAETGSLDAATDRIAGVLRAKAAAAGHPEKYHHTMTVFWMRMVARLLDKDLPLAYYSRERLFSDDARAIWLPPDLRPDLNDDPPLRTGDPPRDTPHRAVAR